MNYACYWVAIPLPNNQTWYSPFKACFILLKLEDEKSCDRDYLKPSEKEYPGWEFWMAIYLATSRVFWIPMTTLLYYVSTQRFKMILLFIREYKESLLFYLAIDWYMFFFEITLYFQINYFIVYFLYNRWSRENLV